MTFDKNLMIQEIVNIISKASEWNWSANIQAMTGIWVATVATLALHTWRKQSKAQRQLDFLDTLTESVHEFINLIASPTQMVGFIKIGFEAYSSSPKTDKSLKQPGVVSYIEKNGAEDSKRFLKSLKLCEPSLVKIRSLVVKGKVLSLSNHQDCVVACKMITWQYDRIMSLATMIGITPLNWKHPDVERALEKVCALKKEDIVKDLNEYNNQLMEFIGKNYNVILK